MEAWHPMGLVGTSLSPQQLESPAFAGLPLNSKADLDEALVERLFNGLFRDEADDLFADLSAFEDQ